MLGTLTESEIESVLRESFVARIGCHAGGRTYVVPVAYAYDDGGIITHSIDGMKLQMMRANPSVCVEIEQVESLLEWKSVVAWGTFEELDGDAAQRGMALIYERLLPLLPAGPAHGVHPIEEMLARGTVYKIRFVERSGRFSSQRRG